MEEEEEDGGDEGKEEEEKEQEQEEEAATVPWAAAAWKVLRVDEREREREEALAPILKSPLCSEFYIVNLLGL